MYRTKVIISGEWKNGDDSFKINPANIITFTRECDYENNTLPIALIKMRLDKNLIDKMILNEETASIFLTGKKVILDNTNEKIGNAQNVTGWSGEYIYINRSDINYNKEIDYGADETKDRKDMYREIIVGLVNKETNERNRQVENRVVQDSKIQSFIVKAMEDYPLLIEPFTYNNTIDQLSIPPQDTLKKFVQFMNHYKVFYDTPYRFFIDVDCIYLLSSSGKGTKKRDEKFNTVYFKMINPTDNEAHMYGLKEDNTNNRYEVPVLVQDSNYNINKSLGRTGQNISAVIDPDKDNSMANSDEINSAIEAMTAKQQEMVNKINEQIPNIKSGVDDLARSSQKINGACDTLQRARDLINTNTGTITSSMNSVLSSATTVASATIGSLSGVNKMVLDAIDVQNLNELAKNIIEVANLPASLGSTTPPSGGAIGAPLNKSIANFPAVSSNAILASTANKITASINSLSSQINQGATEFNKAKEIGNEIKNKGIKSIYNMVMSATPLKSVSPANFSENVNLMNAIQTMSNNLLSNIAGSLRDKLNEQVDNAVSQVEKINKIYSTAQHIKTILEKTNNVTEAFSEAYNKIEEAATEGEKVATTVNTATALLTAVTGKASGLSKILNTASSFFNTNTIDVGKILTEYSSDWVSLTNTKIKQSISGMLGKLTSSSNPLKVLTGAAIKDGLNKIGTLENLGKSGLAGCNIYLDIGNGNNKGSMTVKVNNDNYNILKNIKAEIENKQNKITLSKSDVDPEVFTPNKEFMIHNFDAHSEKDGHFLLARKVEFYIREDEQFKCNTLLDFFKIKTEENEKQPTATPM